MDKNNAPYLIVSYYYKFRQNIETSKNRAGAWALVSVEKL